MKKINYLIAISISCAALPALAQIPDAPPPSDSKMDPRVEKRVKELKQLGHDKKKDPEAKAKDNASNNASDVSADPADPARPKMGVLRRNREKGMRPDAAQRFASFATASRRGREMKKHLVRMAKLERLEAIAAETDQKVLAKRVVDMRARELRRHQHVVKVIQESRLKRANPSDIKVKIDGEPAQP